MNKKDSLLKILQYIPVANVVLVVASNVHIWWSWYNVLTSESDTMLIGILYLFLLFVSIYDLVLLIWGIRVLIQKSELKKKLKASALIFVLNLMPYVLIYYCLLI